MCLTMPLYVLVSRCLRRENTVIAIASERARAMCLKPLGRMDRERERDRDGNWNRASVWKVWQTHKGKIISAN